MSSKSWTQHDIESCVRSLDRLVTQTKTTHDDEATSGETTNDAILTAQRDREMNELRLFAEAVHGQDVIGLTALTAGFWSHKNAMVRQKHRLEKVLPKKEEGEELLAGLRQLQLTVEDPKDAASVSRLIDTVQRANFVDLARFATECQHRVCEYSPIVAAYQAMGLRGIGGTDASSSISKQPQLMLSEEGQENRLAETVRIADASLQDADMRASQLREQLEGLFSGFEALKLPRAMHSFVPRGIVTGEIAAPSAAAVQTSVPRQQQQQQQPIAAARSESQSQQQSQHQQPLVNGYTTMHLLRVLCVEAAPHDTPEGLAAQYGVETHCITDVHQQPLQSLEAFREPTLVLIHIGTPMRGLDESLTSLNRRIELIETTTLPRAKQRLVSAREALWSSELEGLQAPLKGDAAVQEKRRAVDALERDQKRAQEVLEQCKTHRECLLAADFGRVSFLLEGKQLEALEGLGASERLVYMCKEIPKGVSVADFASRMGLPASEVVTFIDDETGGAMAYVPTLVPRASLAALDEEIRKEFNDFKAQHPELPPRTDLLEHLSALRGGDVSSLSQMLSTTRKELEAADAGRAKVEADELRAALTKQQEHGEAAQRIIDSRNDTIQLLRTQNDDLRTAVTAAKERADAADRALQSAKNDCAALDTELKDAQSRCSALTEGLTAAEHRNGNMSRELQILHSQHNEEMSASKSTTMDEIGVLTANRTAMQAQIDSLSSTVGAQRDEIASYVKRLDTATTQRDESREALEKLRTQLAESNVQVKQAAVLQSEKNMTQTQLDTANAELAELRRVSTSAVENAKAQVRAAEAKLEALQAQYKKLEEDTTRAIQARDLQLASAHEACRKTETTANAARESAEQEATVLRKQLQNVTSDLATSRADRWNKAEQLKNADASSVSSPTSPNRSSLLQPGLASPQRGILDEPLATAAGSSPHRRVVYVCRPLPRGTTVNTLAAEFGVSVHDIVGPFTETHTGDQFCYLPTMAATSSDVIREDERIRNAIAASGREGMPSVALLETLHALRSGDVASLAQKVLDGEERVAKAEALLALQARSDALTGMDGSHGMPPLDVADTQALLDDDHTHDSIEVLREKIMLLKDALSLMRARVTEWKSLAEDYKQQLIEEQADDVNTEQVKADFQHRLDAKQKEILGLEQEVGQLRQDLAGAEQRKDEELAVLALARQKLVADKDNTIANMKRQYEEIRSERDRLLKILNEAGEDAL